MGSIPSQLPKRIPFLKIGGIPRRKGTPARPPFRETPLHAGPPPAARRRNANDLQAILVHNDVSLRLSSQAVQEPMQQAVPLASSPFGRFARFGKMHRYMALGLRLKARKGFTLVLIPLRRGFSTVCVWKPPAFTAFARNIVTKARRRPASLRFRCRLHKQITSGLSCIQERKPRKMPDSSPDRSTAAAPSNCRRAAVAVRERIFRIQRRIESKRTESFNRSQASVGCVHLRQHRPMRSPAPDGSPAGVAEVSAPNAGIRETGSRGLFPPLEPGDTHAPALLSGRLRLARGACRPAPPAV